MAEKQFKLDIFGLLNKLNSRNSGDIYAELSEEERKGFAPLVVMRWMSGTADEKQVMMLNEFVNPYVFALGKHPHLLMQSLQVASSKNRARCSWIAGSKSSKHVLRDKVLCQYYDFSVREVGLMSPKPSDAEIISMAEELGFQKEELAKLKKELTVKE
jgi:hypothetical protein